MAAHLIIHLALHSPILVRKYLEKRSDGKAVSLALRETASEGLLETVSLSRLILRLFFGAFLGLVSGVPLVVLGWWVFAPTSFVGWVIGVASTVCILVITTLLGVVIKFVGRTKLKKDLK